MSRAMILLATVIASCGWVHRAEAQTTQVTTEYLMTVYAPLERRAIDSVTAIVNVRPGGWVRGPRIRGTIVPPGGDWVTTRPSGVVRLDVRLLIQTDDSAHVYVTYNGVFVTSPEVTAALNRGEVVTDKTVPYFVTAPTFQTSSPKYDWLNKVQAVGKMVELKRGDDYYIKYDIFVVR